MPLSLVFVHGFGFTPSCFDKVIAGIPYPTIVIDHWCVPPTLPDFFIGIGHSLGCAWLLSTFPHRLKGLVAISGFGCFIQNNTNPLGIPFCVVKHMQRNMHHAPRAVLKDFYKRCCIEQEVRIDDLPLPALVHALDYLIKTDVRDVIHHAPFPIKAIHGTQDHVVPYDLARHHFPTLTPLDTNSHVLPLTHSQHIIQAIDQIVSQITTFCFLFLSFGLILF
jgi:pimeloyl-[acyl-carrier protein] methyl ester esterase